MIVNGKRSLAHVEKVAWLRPIEGTDNIELIGVLGWTCICKSKEFREGDLCVFIEIDSKVPQKQWCEFLREDNFEIKTKKLPNSNIISQGLALPVDIFDIEIPKKEGSDVTELLDIKYSNPEKDLSCENESPSQNQKELFDSPMEKGLMKRRWGKSIMSSFFGVNEEKSKDFPTKFANISNNYIEYCENIPDILNDKTPYIRTQKCDGICATYILEKANSKSFNSGYEFYVCSRNHRIFEEDNPYWEMADQYDIEEKLIHYLENHKDCDYVCWQGEICGPEIKNNPHELDDNELFCFNMVDSNGKFDIREAQIIWDEYDMESVPIDFKTYILPDDFEEFKLSADKNYDPTVCDGQTGCEMEGWVYYKTTDSSFSFKNISRRYLLKIEDQDEN